MPDIVSAKRLTSSRGQSLVYSSYLLHDLLKATTSCQYERRCRFLQLNERLLLFRRTTPSPNNRRAAYIWVALVVECRLVGIGLLQDLTNFLTKLTVQWGLGEDGMVC